MNTTQNTTLRPTTVAILGLLTIAGASKASAQTFLPDSPKASLTQTIGFDEITLSYSRPRVKGRKIWGELVPFGEVWRTGADYPTRIHFPSSVRVEGSQLDAGTYALYTIPGEQRWTVIFSRNTELWGAYGYQAKDDALRVSVEPEQAPFAESFTFIVENVDHHAATLVLHWERLRVPVRIEVDIHQQAMGNIRKGLEEQKTAENPDWGFYWRAAKYLLERGDELEQALEWVESSLQLDRNWMNLWTAARLAGALGELEEAIRAGEEAVAVCERDSEYCPYVSTYRSSVAEWRRSLSPR